MVFQDIDLVEKEKHILCEGKEYIICLKANPRSFGKGSGFNEADIERISKHKFFYNRPVIFMGYDKEYKFGDSFIFCDKHMKLYENLKEKEDYDAFMQMTFICASHSNNEGNWVFHIVEDRFEIKELVPE